LQVGQELISGYKLQQMRGRGSFGSVWEATTADGKTVAMKVMPCNDTMAATKELRALQAVRQLSHPNLIRIDQVWSHAGFLVIGMELADGSLLDLLEAYQSEYGTALDAAEACTHLMQAARALDFMNARTHTVDRRRVGFQHCDVKPSNLLLFGDVLKIADLGLAVMTLAQVTYHHWAGTLDYSAPEVFLGRVTDWSDQFALAVTYCHIRSGRLPFPNVPISESWPRSYVRPAPDLSMLTPHEQPIIQRALSTVPQQRWPSCVAMMTQLQQATMPERKPRTRAEAASR
jgi:serine/threonine protein kinase